MVQSLEAALLLACEGPSRRCAQRACLTVPVPGNDSAEWQSALSQALGEDDTADRPSGTYVRPTVTCPAMLVDDWVRTLFAPFADLAPPRAPSFVEDEAPASRSAGESGGAGTDFASAAFRILEPY